MDLTDSLIKIGVPAGATRVYLRLLEVKRASARELAEHLDIPRPSVYDHLKYLAEQGLVTEMEEVGKKIFHVEDSQQLMGFIQGRVESLTKEKEAIAELLPKYISSKEVEAPRIKSYAGVDGIRKALNEMLWYENIETLTVWPTNDMAEVLGNEYLADLNRKRIHHNISVKSIWPAAEIGNLKKYPFLGVGGGHLRERRIAPQDMKWSMSYWLFGDKVVFISSHKESFGFVVQSNDFTSLIKASFEALWQISTPTDPQPQFTDSFLETIKR